MGGTTNRGRGRFSRGELPIRLRAALEVADRMPLVRGVARAVAERLAAATLARIGRRRGVLAAYARGSHGRGDFVPLASDLDLAIVLREPDRRPDFATTLGVLGALSRMRVWNPLLRDTWHLIVGETEWPLVERHWSLFQLDDWRDRDGRPRPFARAPADARLALAARWNRLHLWTDSALRHVLAPAPWNAERALAFAAAEKKALWFAAALAGEPPPRRRQQPPRGPGAAHARAAKLLQRLEEAAGRVAAAAGLEPRALPPGEPPHDAGEQAIADAVVRHLPDEAGSARLLLHSGIVAVALAQPPPAAEQRVALVAALERAAAETGKRWFPYLSPLSLALAPIYEPVRVLDPAAPRATRALDAADAAGPAPGMPVPFLLAEQLRYEALFAGADLRATAARAPDDPGLVYTTRRLARLLVWLETGKLERDGEAAVSAARRLHRDVDAAVAREPARREERFAVNAALFVAIVAALEGEAAPGLVGPAGALPAKKVPEGFERATPYICVNDAAAAIEFYKKAFGATETMRLAEPGGRIGHAEVKIGGAPIMLSDEYPDHGATSPQTLGGTAVAIHLYVDDVDAFVARAEAAGAKVERPVQDQFYGDRSATLLDPYGHRWFFATHKETLTPEETQRRYDAVLKAGG